MFKGILAYKNYGFSTRVVMIIINAAKTGVGHNTMPQ